MFRDRAQMIVCFKRMSPRYIIISNAADYLKRRSVSISGKSCADMRAQVQCI